MVAFIPEWDGEEPIDLLSLLLNLLSSELFGLVDSAIEGWLAAKPKGSRGP